MKSQMRFLPPLRVSPIPGQSLIKLPTQSLPNRVQSTCVPFYCQGQNTNVFIPCYLRMILKNVKRIEMKRLTAILEGYLQLTINLFQVPLKLAKIITQTVTLEFPNGDSVLLANSPLCLVTQLNHLITFTYGDQIPMILDNQHVFLAPFDLCTITTSVVISCNTYFEKGKKINIRFNIMDCPLVQQKFKLDQPEDVSEFRISRKHLFVQFLASQFDKIIFIQHPLNINQELDRSKSFHYAMYSISQYRYPGVAIITLFVPMWLFAFANLSIFFQTPELHDRISSIATLMIAYTAFIPFLRQRLPLTSRITFLDINLYSLIMTCLICLCESIRLRHLETDNYKFEYKQNLPFIFCAFVLSVSIFYVMGMFLVHKIKWQPQYNRNSKNQEMYEGSQAWDLDFKKWSNSECDRYFAKYQKHLVPINYLKL